MKKTVSCALLVLLSAFAVAQQSEFVSPAGTKYLVYTPASYQTGNQLHPLLISLHGKGEMGDDITMLTSRNPHQMPSRLIYLNRWPTNLPFVVLTPLYNPPVGELNPQWPADYIEEVVQQVRLHEVIQLVAAAHPHGHREAALREVREEVGFGDEAWHADDLETREPLQALAGLLEHRDAVGVDA